MNTEPSSELTRRAAVHAALGDPARLQIVDTLTIGDASPSELAALLGMPSNLLAHHLRVLEAEGLIARTRSEGDKRRSYLHLVAGALEDLTAGRLRPASRVLFVCTANSARSQLAAALWRHASEVPVASAGTHPAGRIDPDALAAAQRHHLPLRRAKPRPIDVVRAPGDLVITVCDLAHEELGERADLHWSVPDPVPVGSAAAFDRAFDQLARWVSDLAARLETPAAS
jgi:protein-tyrosine-phosphatase/DNA-binding transcriptional ArsR family regulator